MSKNRVLIATAALSAAMLLNACSSSVKLDEPVVTGSERRRAPIEDRGGGTGSASSGVQQPNTGQSSIATVNAGATDPLKDTTGPLSKRSIFFDYDSFSVKDEYKTVVEAHARYLNSNKGQKVTIQGNTDERGSREYNLALGQKRAEAVRRALSALGVSDGQLEAVSLGKEKPQAQGADEASYAQNRRADLSY